MAVGAAAARQEVPTLYAIEDHLESIDRKLEAMAARGKVEQLWLSKRETALGLGISVRWLEARMGEGLPHREIAGKRVFRLADVESWLRKRGYLREVT